MTAPRKPLENKPSRMAALTRLPVFFALDGKRAVLAGGSAAAAWKAELLSAAGANVDVYAEAPSDEMRSLANEPSRGPVTIIERAWCAADLNAATIAIGAFDDDMLANAFAKAARAAGVPVNVIDKPDFCDFSFGSIVNRSPLVIGISTDGAAPVFAQAIRAKIEAFLPAGFTQWAVAAARWRPAVKAAELSFAGRRKFWQLFTARAMMEPNHAPSQDDFDAFATDVRSLGTATDSGSVTLVGAGPGDPELLTLRAVRALQSADVILFDDLVSHGVLDFARREARKMLVGKTGYGPSCKQSEINALMVSLARQGKRVVRLKGGDPLVFGRAGEEIDACKAANIAVEIVPGITAAQGAASRLGIPLTDRRSAQRLQFLTGHSRNGTLPGDIHWQSLCDPAVTTAVYMPAKTLQLLIERAMREGLDPATPAAAIASATRPNQRVIAAPIGELHGKLEAEALEGPVLVMIGGVCAALGERNDSVSTRAAN